MNIIKIIVLCNIFCCAASLRLIAQNEYLKHDYIWMSGTDNSNSDFQWYGGNKIDFATTPPTVTDIPFNLNMYATNTTMADSAGNLLFYTNGVQIRNALGNVMENGAGLNPSYFTELYGHAGLIIPQGVLALPYPGHPNQYMLIHEIPDYFDVIPTLPELALVFNLRYSLIDMNQNDGLGRVVAKNQVILADTLAYGGLTAVRHGNGRDWWIVLSEYGANCNYSMLLSPEGFSLPNRYCIGDSSNHVYNNTCVFSPDGSRFIRSEERSITLYDFDRCSGELSHPIHIPFEEYTAGIAMSPNSHYLYVSSYMTKLYQLDLLSPDPASTRILVAEVNTEAPNDTTNSFALLQLAPDGKIYMCAYHSYAALAVIQQPNEGGVACNVQQQAVLLYNYNNVSVPNYPNYRLGALPPERCGEALGQAVVAAGSGGQALRVYPNPAHHTLHVQTPANFERGEISIYSPSGALLATYSLQGGSNSIQLHSLSSGLYYYTISTKQQIVQRDKLMMLD